MNPDCHQNPIISSLGTPIYAKHFVKIQSQRFQRFCTQKMINTHRHTCPAVHNQPVVVIVVSRDVASVLTPQSRDRLDAQQCLGSVSPRLNFQMPQSRLGLETERLGLGLGHNTEGLGLGLGSKRLGLVGKHFSITYRKLRLNMDVGCGLGLVVSVSRPSRGTVVPRLRLNSELVFLSLVSDSSSEGLGLGLASD